MRGFVLNYRKFLFLSPAALAILAVTSLGLPACSDPEIATGMTAGTGGHSSGHGGDGGSSGTFDSDGGVGGSTGTMIEPDAACATETAKAEIIPVNMLILFDRSASMA